MLIGFSGVAAALAIGLGLSVRSEEISRSTGCPLNHRPPSFHTFVLLDETDRLSRNEIDYARAVVMNEYYWLPIGGRLTVRNIVSSPDNGVDIVVCRLDDGAKVLGLSRNPKKVRLDFQRIAGTRLNQLLANVATAPTQEYSPIVETVSAVLDRADFGRNVKNRRLVIISDMAQHSNSFTQYGSRNKVPDLGEFRRDMSGVDVRIHYIRRASLERIQVSRHRRFWLGYFRDMGAQADLGHGLLLGEDPNKETWSDTPK